MQYNLEQLGPTGFQDLAASLAVAEFGPNVQALGPGRDGGRDMVHSGRTVWTAEDGAHADAWDGYTVFQVKHKHQLDAKPEDNASWLRSEVGKELERWASPASGRDPVPDYMVIVSNVRLSPYPGGGGYDGLRSDIAAFINQFEDDTRDIDAAATEARLKKLARLRKIRGWQFWDGNQVEKLLAAHASVRHSFPAFLTAADVFANLSQFTNNLPAAELEPALRSHARSALTSDGLIYFDEAGGSEGSGFPVHELATDLPITTASGELHVSAIGYVLDRAEHMLKPRTTMHQRPRHLVVTGAPGNGKTTLSKFLVQVFRTAMLDGAASLSLDQQRVIDGTRAALARLDRPLPRHRRWAMRIDLAEYAQEGGLITDSTLLRWIAQKVSARSNHGDIQPSLLKSWMTRWPWFLVLDGLDEVTEPHTRKRLIQQVTEFVDEAEADNCDTLVVLTTRPVGYTEQIAPNHFERVDLDYLRLNEALRYGSLAIRVRLGGDIERAERALRRLREAANDDSLKNLLRTPLQVLILTIIVEASGQLPPDRFSLFWSYYETIFRRERDKPGDFSYLLREHGTQIQQLHERIGFELQARSEIAQHSYATLTYAELREVAWSVLDDEGFRPAGKDADLLTRLLNAATHRLVLIAPRGNEGYGFDVRSLQELMAAMRLTNAEPETVHGRLRQAAASPHWRNTWIFAVGRIFATPQGHQHAAVVQLINELDRSAPERLGTVVPAAPRLALEIVDDGMVRSMPKWRAKLVTHGLQVLQEPIPGDLRSIARILLRYADLSDDQTAEVSAGIRRALDGESVASRATALALQEQIPVLAEEMRLGLRAKGLARVLKTPNAKLERLPREPDWAAFDEEILTAPVAPAVASVVQEAAEGLHNLLAGAPDDHAMERLMEGLRTTESSEVLQAALQHVTEKSSIFVELRDRVLPTVNRQPIGDSLR